MEQTEFFSRVQVDPVFHIETVQGVRTLKPYQRRVIKTVAENRLTAIAACHDVGKTFMMAKIALWFGSSFQGCKIITTAPTWLQVELLLWSEIRAGFHSSKFRLGGRMLTTEWKIDDDWFAVGISPKEDADSSGGGQGIGSSFQGFHAPYILVIFDEATGVPPKRWLQAQGMLTSANVRFVAVGNPTTKNCDFYQCFQSRIWKKVYISCFDSPNLIANGVTDIQSLTKEVDLIRGLKDDKAAERIAAYKIDEPALLTLSWVVERALTWGMKHPLFISKALGTFPDEDDSTLISLGSVEKAQGRKYDTKISDRVGIGVDVARYGSDSSVITSIAGNLTLQPVVLAKRDTMEIAGATIRELNRVLKLGFHPSLISVGIDATGIGAGVYDSIRETQRSGGIPRDITLYEVHFGQGFDYMPERKREELKKNYINRKAKIFVELAEDLKGYLALDDSGIYLEELPTLISSFDSKGRHVMEDKESYRERTGRASPDHSDSLAIANEMRKMTGTGVGTMVVLR